VFPSLASYHLGHDKIAMTRALQTRWEALLPRTLIAANDAAGRAGILAALPLPFVAKTPKASEGRGVYLIEDDSDWERYCATHDRLYAQELLPIDRDLRIVVVGTAVVGSYWRRAPAGAFLNNLAAGGRLDFAAPPPRAVDAVLDVARSLGIDHAGFDVAMVDGEPRILEFNRLFGNRGLVEQGIRPDRLVAAHLAAIDAPPRPRRGGGRRRRAA
jgi:ribosomal protein S6--L-glutamate ligase